MLIYTHRLKAFVKPCKVLSCKEPGVIFNAMHLYKKLKKVGFLD